MKKCSIMLLFLLLITTALWAGDLAVFVNLGFSDDASHFMFAQYGVPSDSLNPYAEIYYVNVEKNNFADLAKEDFDVDIQLGQDGQGALFSLLNQNIETTNRLNINHLNSGRLLYILINGNEPKPHLSFRDFVSEYKYSIDLIQKAKAGTSDKEEGSAAFHIELTLTKDGKGKEYKIGLPNYYRKGVADYRISHVLVAPDNKSVVFIVEKKMIDGSIRYMVETVKL